MNGCIVHGRASDELIRGTCPECEQERAAPSEPRTEAGRRLMDRTSRGIPGIFETESAVLAIEVEAARLALPDDERLAIVLHSRGIAGVDGYASWVAYARAILAAIEEASREG